MAGTLFDRVAQYRTDVPAIRHSPEAAWRLCGEGLERYRETLREANRYDVAPLMERFIEFIDSPSGVRFVEQFSSRLLPLRFEYLEIDAGRT